MAVLTEFEQRASACGSLGTDWSWRISGAATPLHHLLCLLLQEEKQVRGFIARRWGVVRFAHSIQWTSSNAGLFVAAPAQVFRGKTMSAPICQRPCLNVANVSLLPDQ